MTKEEAQAAIEVLSKKTGEPDTRGWGEQYIELTRVLRKGTALEQATVLQRLYRTPGPVPSTHELMITRYEEQLLPLLAKALKKAVGPLKGTLHRGQPAFGYEAPFRESLPIPSKPKSLKHWTEEDGFHVYGSGLVLGEGLSEGGDDNEAAMKDGAMNMVWPALNGAWLVLWRPSTYVSEEDGETYDNTLWVAVHHEYAERVDELLKTVKKLGVVFVHGGTSAAADVEVREDRSFQRDFENSEPNGRGFIVNLGGDGVCEWRGVFVNEALCLISCDAMD